MKVPTIIAPDEQQAPLRVPYSDLNAGPGAFGAGLAQGAENLNQSLQDVALAKQHDAVALDVSEQVAAAQDLSNQSVTKARSVTGPEAAQDGFVDPYDKEIVKAWEDAASATKSPQAKAIVQAKGRQDHVMSMDAIRNHSADQRTQYKKTANELVVTRETEAAALDPQNASRQATSEQNISAMVRANLKGAPKEDVDTAVASAASAMYLTVAKGISDKDPSAASAYYEAHKDKILEGEDKKTFEHALATKAKDFHGEMLAREAVADPKSKTIEDVYAYLQKKTASDKDTVRYDEAKQRATDYFNADLHAKKEAQDAFVESAYMRLHKSGYDIGVFTTGDIAQMGSENYEKMKNYAMGERADKAAMAAAKGELTPMRAAHVQAWADFQANLRDNPRMLVQGHDFVNEWAYRLGPEYVDDGMKAWRQVQYDMENPGSKTVESQHAVYVVQDQLRSSFPKLFPPGDSPTKWSSKASTMFLNVESHLNDRIKLEQKNQPGKDPTPADIQAWTIDAIKDVKRRSDGETVRAYTLSPEDLRNPDIVMPEDEQRFRDFYVPFFQKTSRLQRTPQDGEVRGAYLDWVSKGRPQLPVEKPEPSPNKPDRLSAVFQ